MFELTHPASVFSLVGIVTCGTLATWVLRRLPRDGRTDSLAMVCVGVALLHVYQFVGHAAVHIETAIAVQSLLHGVYSFTSVAAALFGLHYTRRGHIARRRSVQTALWAWCAFTTLWLSSPIVERTWHASARGGWYSTYDLTALRVTAGGNALLGLSLLALVLHDLRRFAHDPRRRRDNRLVAWGAGITLILGVPTDVLLPAAGVTDAPRVLGIAFLVFLGLMVWGLSRRRWLGFSMEQAAPLALERNGDGAVVLDASGQMHFANEAASRLLDPGVLRQLARSAADGDEDTVQTVQARGRHLQVRWTPLEERDPDHPMALGLIRDVTDLEEARRDAESARAASQRFLARMSHELRTPLNAIIGYSELVAEEHPASRHDLDRIERSGRYLLGLINDMLDLSKVQAGRMELRPATLRLSTVLADLDEQCAPLFSRERTVFEWHVAPELTVQADPTRLRQILLNLLSNAAKFSEGHPVQVTASTDGQEVCITVTDRGIGMGPEQLERLFEPFSQVHAHPGDRYGGTGLGLVVSSELAQRMGGSLQVVSAPGEGSAFTLRLPATVGAETTGRTPEGPASPRRARSTRTGSRWRRGATR